MDSVRNKVVLITGASSGIGKACASVFGKAGARLAICGRNEKTLKKTIEEFKQNNIEILGITADVSKEEDCKKFINETIAGYGQIDILINNAGISMRAAFENLSLGVLRQLMDINFWGAVYCSKYALPYILQRHGSIVGVSSIAGYRGLPGRTGYSASKFAMQGFLEALRSETLHKGIHIMWIAPGFTESNIRNTALNAEGNAQSESPLEENKLMSSEEVARHILRGVLQRKRTIILSTQGKLTVFLNKWFPGLMDKLVYNHMSREKYSPI